VRVTVSHNKPKEDVKRAVDRSFNDLFAASGSLPVQIVNVQRNWQGETLLFSCRAKMGFLSSDIKGTVEVTDKDVTIDADLGIFEKLIPAKTAQSTLESKVRGLLA
jgi:putative polyhydroxyalkanoic acid system protein